MLDTTFDAITTVINIYFVLRYLILGLACVFLLFTLLLFINYITTSISYAKKEIGILKYLTPAGENVELHLYLAKDTGQVTRKINPKDKEEALWVDIEKVEEKILYQDLNRLWLDMKNKITK